MTSPDRKQAERQQQMDVLQQMTELLDSLPSREAQREVLAFLVASIGGRMFDAPRPTRSSYPARSKSRSW